MSCCGFFPGDGSAIISRWIAFPILATDFTAAAFTETITLWTMPAGTKIQNALLVTDIGFVLAGLTGYHIKIGIPGDLNRYANNYNVRLPAAPTNFSFNFGPWLESVGAGVAVQASATSAGKHLDLVSIGEATLYLEVSNIFGTVLP